jgi:hypothetical protein
VSRRFESVINLARVQTWQHDKRRPGGHHEWQKFHDEVKETIRAHLTLVHVFHAYASTDTPWVAHALSHFTSVWYGRIASVSVAHSGTQFRDSICLVCVNTFKCLFIRTQPTRALYDSGEGYHLGAPNIRWDHSPSFSSSILHFPLIARPVSNYANHSIILLNHTGPPSIERALSQAESNHSSSTDSLDN